MTADPRGRRAATRGGDHRVAGFVTVDAGWACRCPRPALAGAGTRAAARVGSPVAGPAARASTCGWPGGASPPTRPAACCGDRGPRGPPALVGGPTRVQRSAGSLRAGLRAASGRPARRDERGLLPGLVVGDTSRVPPIWSPRCRRTGLTHLVAVSGANLAIVVGAGLVAAARSGVRGRGLPVVGSWRSPGSSCSPGPAPRRPGCRDGRPSRAGALASGRPRPRCRRSLPRSSCWCWPSRRSPRTRASRCRCRPPRLRAARAGLVAALRRAGCRGAAEPWRYARQPGWSPRRWWPRCPGGSASSSVPANLLAAPAVAPATVLGRAAALCRRRTGLRRCRDLAGRLAGPLAGARSPGAAAVPGGRPAGRAVSGAAAARGDGAAGALARWPWPRPARAGRCAELGRPRPPLRQVTGLAAAGGGCRRLRRRAGRRAGAGRRRPGDAVVVDAGPEPALSTGCLRRLGVRRRAARAAHATCTPTTSSGLPACCAAARRRGRRGGTPTGRPSSAGAPRAGRDGRSPWSPARRRL